MSEHTKDFDVFKEEGVAYLTRMACCLREAPIVGRAFSKEIDELESKAVALLGVSTREEWKTLIDRDINPLFDSLNNGLAFRFDINIEYVLTRQGFFGS